MADIMTCTICRGTKWVCVDHPTTPWGFEPWCCPCGAEGAPCVCNPDARMPPGVETVASVEPGKDRVQ